MKNDTTLARLVAEDIRRADVFSKYEIDFCCNGNRTLQQACIEQQLDLEMIKTELQLLPPVTAETPDFGSMPLDNLVDYILVVHHKYVAANIPLLHQYLDKIVDVHGDDREELEEISHLFHEVAMELQAHMQKEEMILFPAIKQMVNPQKYEADCCFDSVEGPISVMEHEHDNAGNIFKRISQLSDNYNPPAVACDTYRLTFAKLKEFEQDLHKHIHLENNILFPKAIKLEQEVASKQF